MCKHEIVGDMYRGCGHFHGRYFTGEEWDCNDEKCKTSKQHKKVHQGKCNCPQLVVEQPVIQNLFQIAFPECKDCHPRSR